MVCVFLLGSMICCYLMCYLLNILECWEVIYTMVFTLPLWLYCRKDTAVWSRLFGTNMVFLLVRVGVITLVARSYTRIIMLPISFDQPSVRKICGIIQIACWTTWFVMCGIQMIATCKDRCDKIKESDKLNDDHMIVRSRNIFNLTSMFIIIFHATLLTGYCMNEIIWNVAMQACIILILNMVALYIVKKMINDRHAEITVDEHKKDKD